MLRHQLSLAALLVAIASPIRAEFTEYRSIFVDRFDFPYQSASVASMQATIDGMMQKAADEGFTEVIWQVRARGDALYDSNVEPHANGLTAGFDPLETAIDSAHARGLKLHAWLNATPLWSNHAPAGEPPLDHIYHNTSPSLRLQDLAGNLEPKEGWSNYSTANPILPAMHAHVNSVVTDIATNYDVDGIHLDYIRYIPGTFNETFFARMPHDPVSHQMFADATGGLNGGDVANFQAYKSFLTNRITDLVGSVKQNVDALEVSEGRAMELTASLFFEPNRAKNEYSQDWGRWIDEGLLDVAMPMIYISAQNDELFDPYLASAMSFKNAATGTRVAPTIASYLHMNPTRGGGVELTLAQMQSSYDMGADGVGFYDYPAFFNAYSAGDRQQIKTLLESLEPEPPLTGGEPGDVLDDFEVDEGHFGWAYNLSPASQTNGLATGTTIDRVVDEAESGAASQRLALVASTEGGPWNLRHNSGTGAGLNANPVGNVALEATGSVGFWLKTSDAGVSVQIGIDDPVSTGATAIEKGAVRQVIADDQWHLYQWNLESANDWVAFGNPGSDGDIDATAGTVTIDSIFLSGAGSAVLYLDTISHNADGPLTSAGDFNGDGTVDGDDLTAWNGGFGKPSDAVFAEGDGDGDGDVDGGDWIVWQRHLGVSNTATAPATANVPEPTPVALLTAISIAMPVIRRVGGSPTGTARRDSYRSRRRDLRHSLRRPG